MEAMYHREMLRKALGKRVSARALAAITQGNLRQDTLLGLLRPEFHFDESLFEKALAYIEQCRDEAAQAVDPGVAWAAFGRLTHGAQDFYAHSNYVQLWADMQTLIPGDKDHERAKLPPPAKMKALDPYLLKHPKLRSGRVYYPLEALWYFPFLQQVIKPFLPRDSHAWMNLDKPSTGVLFPYAIEAAIQRTVVEFERTLALIGEQQGQAAMKRFQDLGAA